MPVPELVTKYKILSRRVASLPSELDAWVEWAAAGNTLERNFSQIRMLDYFMRALCTLNKDGVGALDLAGDVDVFLDGALTLSENMIKSQAVWSFFRERLELRFVPQFRQDLLMADLVSYDCYTTIMDRAEALGIIFHERLREYPLIGLVTQCSPATWPRGWRPAALQNRSLPVPVIDLPWDQMVNPWGLLAIAHEVGHDVDEDLGKLTEALQPAITARMNETRIPAGRFVKWQRWTSEILADLVGVLLTGPAFVSTLIELLMLPRHYVRHISSTDEHPPPYLRILINAALVRRLGLSQSADALETRWRGFYGEPGDDFGPYLSDIEPVLSAILEAPLDALRNRQNGQRHSLSELLTFTPDDQVLIDEAAAGLSDDVLPGKLSIRHVVSVSQVVFEQAVQTGDPTRLEGLAQLTRQTIIALSPPGQLAAGVPPRRARQYLEDLARALLEHPLEDFGPH